MATSFARTRYRRPEEAGVLSARTVYGEIFDNDEAFGLFRSIAASGEAQAGCENGRIAALVPGLAGLAARIARHGAGEDRHGCIFTALLRKRGLEPVAVPPTRATPRGWRTPAWGQARKATIRGTAYRGRYRHLPWRTAGSPQRASEQMRPLRGHAGIARAVRVMSRGQPSGLLPRGAAAVRRGRERAGHPASAAAEHGNRHDRSRCHSPANPAADADLPACSLSDRTRAEHRARTDDLLQITKALLIRER